MIFLGQLRFYAVSESLFIIRKAGFILCFIQ